MKHWSLAIGGLHLLPLKYYMLAQGFGVGVTSLSYPFSLCNGSETQLVNQERLEG